MEGRVYGFPPQRSACGSSFECADLARDPSFSDSAPFAGNRVPRVAGQLASETDSFPFGGGQVDVYSAHEGGEKRGENEENGQTYIKT